MLMDVLGIVIAFSSIMLLFSLLVTSINQAIQNVMQLRYKQLQVGVKELSAYLSQSTSEMNTQVLASYIDSTLSGTKVEKQAKKIAAYISKEEVQDKINNAITQHVPKEKADITRLKLLTALDNYFPKFEFVMQHRFQRYMEVMSVAVALTISVCFQINTFDLLKTLSTQPEIRKEYILAGEAMMAKQSTIATAQINEPNNMSSEELKAQINTTNQALNQNVGNIALYNFSLFPKGMYYYFGENEKPFTFSVKSFLSNWLGMIVSAILISLGAPFWFNTLKTLFKIRDQILKR